MLKVLFRTNELAPYRIPLFAKIARSSDISLKVLLNSSRDDYKNWSLPSSLPFDCEVVPGVRVYFRRQGSYYTRRAIYLNLVSWYIYRFCPDVIVSQDFSLSSIQALLYSKIFRCRYYSFSEGTCFTEKNATRLQRMVRALIIGSSDAHVVTSSDAADYIRSFAKHSSRIVVSMQTTDTALIKRLVSEEREHTRRTKGGTCHVLYVGQLAERKGVWQLLEAASYIRGAGVEFVLDILGDGDLAKPLARRVEEKRLADQIQFHGWCAYEELYKYLATADLFILLTLEDTYGVVVNEAMAAGLPIVVSKYAGAARDMVVEGENGFIVDPFAPSEVADRLMRLFKDAELRERFGSRSGELVENFTIERSAEAIVKAITYWQECSRIQRSEKA